MSLSVSVGPWQHLSVIPAARITANLDAQQNKKLRINPLSISFGKIQKIPQSPSGTFGQRSELFRESLKNFGES